MSQIDVSSVPLWARPGQSPADVPADTGGRSQVLVGVGAAAGPIVDRWIAEIPGRTPVSRILVDDVQLAGAELDEALRDARVGVRVLIAGPAGACLRLRGVALSAGLEDDEIRVMRCGAGPIDIFCAHCGASTPAIADVDDIVECAGCARHLLVYYHVSRRTGRYLGFMVDAETAPTTAEETDR